VKRYGKSIHVQTLNYRLMLEHEVPEWVKIKIEDTNLRLEDFGAGKRERKTINYADDLTDAQFVKILSEGKDMNEEKEKIRKKKQTKRRGRDETEDSEELSERRIKRRKLNDGSEEASEPISDIDEEKEEEKNYLMIKIPKKKGKAENPKKEKSIIKTSKRAKNVVLDEEEEDDVSIEKEEESEIREMEELNKMILQGFEDDDEYGNKGPASKNPKHLAIIERERSDVDEDSEVLPRSKRLKSHYNR